MMNFKQLKVWKKSHQFVLDIYKLSTTFPKEEQYGMTAQLRRAATSIPANIAEGCGRESKKEFTNFVNIALGSASEVEYFLLLVHDLGWIDPETYNDLNPQLIEIKKWLQD